MRLKDVEMGIKTNQRLLEENIDIKKTNVKLKQEEKGLLGKVMSMFSSLEETINDLKNTVSELKDKEVIVTTSSSGMVDSNSKLKKKEKVVAFIPSVDTSGLSIQASKPIVRKRSVNVSKSVSELSKIKGEKNANPKEK